MKKLVVGILAIGLALPVSAQSANHSVAKTAPAAVQSPPTLSAPVQSVAMLEAVPQQHIMRAGTEVPLLTREELTTKHKKLRVGQRFQMEVASNVEVNGVVVIPVGTPAVGEVTEVRNKGMWGKSGYINARVLSLRLGDRTIRLSGTFDDKGVTGTAGVVGAVAFVPIAGFFTTGTSAKIPVSSPVKAFLDEDIAFRAVAAQPQVIEVPVAATVTPAASSTVPATNARATATTEPRKD